MTKSLKINKQGLEVVFLQRYLIWRDYCNLYRNHRHPVIEFVDNGIPVFNFRDIQGINKSNSELIIIDCSTEGIHAINCFKQYNPNKKYIIISNGDWDQDHYNLPIEYDLMHTVFFLFEMADSFNTPNRFSYYGDKSYNFDLDKPYSFVSTIGNVRPERDFFVKKILDLHPARKFILRYSGQDHAQPSNHLDVITFSPGDFDPYIEIDKRYYHNVSQSLPMDMYNSARFNLVVETDLDYSHCFFLTEKTIKSILTGMPFVSMSHPGFLQRVRKLGFETYNSLWDESYDQELDYSVRVDKVVKLCNTLCDFDWGKHRPQLEMIKLKNQSNFLNLNKIIDQEFRRFESIIEQYI